MTINDMAQEIITLTRTQAKIRYESLPVDDPKQRRPDISKANKILNWHPIVNRTEGLKQTINYYKQLPPEDLKQKKFTYYNQEE